MLSFRDFTYFCHVFFAGKAVIDLTMQGLNKKVNLERELSLQFYCTIVGFRNAGRGRFPQTGKASTFRANDVLS